MSTDPFSLGAWARERPRLVVALLSAVVLVLCSAIALSRGDAGDGTTEVLAQASEAPAVDDALEPSATASPLPRVAVRPTTPAPPTPTPTPPATAAPSATTAAPFAPAPVVPVPRGTTSAPTLPRPTSTSTTSSPTTTPPLPTLTLSPSSSSRLATVTVVNDYDEPVTFRVNTAFVLVVNGGTQTLTFTPRAEDSYAVDAIGAGCRESRTGGLGIEPGGSYRVTIVSKPCEGGNEDETGPGLSAVPWPEA